MKDTHKNPTMSFRPTKYEKERIEARIELSGMQKRKYIINSCIYNKVVVVGKKENIQRIIDALKEMLDVLLEIERQLRNGVVSFNNEEFELMKVRYEELIKMVVDIIKGADYLFLKNDIDNR